MPLNFTLIWLIVGALLCAAELFLPTAFVAFVLGLSALFTGFASLFIPHFGLQATLWVALSGVLIWQSRRFVPSRKIAAKLDSTEAKTLTEITPGETGRVLYEGNSWNAQCEDEVAIAPNQKVYVVGRRGTTLLVMPQNLLSR